MPTYTATARLAALAPWLSSMQHGLLVLVAFTLPMPFQVGIWVNSVATMALLTSTLLLFAGGPSQRQFEWRQWWLPMLLLAYVVGLVQAIEWQPSWFEVEKKLSWLVFPLIFSLAAPSRKAVEEAGYWFVGALIALLVLAVLAATILYGRDGDMSHFAGTSLLYPLSLHRVYTALHLLVAALLVLAWPRKGIFKWGVFTVLVAAQLLLASRTSLITSAILGICVLVYLLTRKRLMLALWVSVGFTAVGLALSQLPYVHNQMVAMLDPTGQPNAQLKVNEGVSIRRVLWQSAWELVRERPLIGYGTGNDRILLPIKYREKDLEMAAKDHYNAHNQYLQTWLETGLPGLLILLAFLGSFFYTSRHVGHWLPAAIGVVFTLALVSECMLNAQKGSVFIAFVSGCLFCRFGKQNGDVKD